MNATASSPVRLTPEQQAEDQQSFNDPAKHGSPEWHAAAKRLFAAGVIETDPTIAQDLKQAAKIADGIL